MLGCQIDVSEQRALGGLFPTSPGSGGIRCSGLTKTSPCRTPSGPSIAKHACLMPQEREVNMRSRLNLRNGRGYICEPLLEAVPYSKRSQIVWMSA
ncbi:hypothetical protein BCR34DRAFT_24484 [Clohesyomyces aquaticus]|uniref:Uncharacterized protein n=1 Tax=Clohesyomyces aquaticus TaxID=1231657 RepID=A0A1Y2A5C3_9PLEO|nr:hypothetical protein BCR34DRAFT_24484 [Clohesyomyces aquaticus]